MILLFYPLYKSCKRKGNLTFCDEKLRNRNKKPDSMPRYPYGNGAVVHYYFSWERVWFSSFFTYPSFPVQEGNLYPSVGSCLVISLKFSTVVVVNFVNFLQLKLGSSRMQMLEYRIGDLGIGWL